MEKEYTLDELLRVARRENNTKRSYLYVDPLQGKHVPVSPSAALEVFFRLAEKVERRYRGEALLVIGFAETATAIGSAIAYRAENARFCMTTTREDVPGAEYLFFTESHSHATEQRLVVNGLADCLPGIDRIVFAEDEVTTGRTIEKLILALRERFPDYRGGFGIASILNSMPEERLRALAEGGVVCDYLCRVPFQYRIGEIGAYRYEPLETELCLARALPPAEEIGGRWNARVVCDVREARARCDAFAGRLLERAAGAGGHVLILGTEEFMFPGLLLGARAEERRPGLAVRFHATTRSPIEVSLDPAYPLHSRAPLESLYESGRRTFVYDLDRYDAVLIVTDAAGINERGLASLAGALERRGSRNIRLIRWGE